MLRKSHSAVYQDEDAYTSEKPELMGSSSEPPSATPSTAERRNGASAIDHLPHQKTSHFYRILLQLCAIAMLMFIALNVVTGVLPSEHDFEGGRSLSRVTSHNHGVTAGGLLVGLQEFQLGSNSQARGLLLQQQKHRQQTQRPNLTMAHNQTNNSHTGAYRKRNIPTEHQKLNNEATVYTIDYFMEKTKTDNTGKERILSLLHDHARIANMTFATYDRLPNWTQVQSLYGNQPRILGLDQCFNFQSTGNLSDKMIGVAGMFNSGTNLLASLLLQNCRLPQRMRTYGAKAKGVRWQVPWGKHTPPGDETFRATHLKTHYQQDIPLTDPVHQVLSAVTIRDPYRWFQSMCRRHYEAHWDRHFSKRNHRHYHCPNFIPNAAEWRELQRDKKWGGRKRRRQPTKRRVIHDELNRTMINTLANHGHYFPVRVRYNNFTRYHYSLVHLWNEWYQEYVQQVKNRIMVRYEDLLFYPDLVVQQVCRCAGGELKHDKGRVRISIKSAKSAYARKGESPTGYLEAIIRYGTPDGRLDGMSQEDLRYVEEYLDEVLMDTFQYWYPELLTEDEDATQ